MRNGTPARISVTFPGRAASVSFAILVAIHFPRYGSAWASAPPASDVPDTAHASPSAPSASADPIRVLFLGGGNTSHNPDSMKSVLIPVFEKAGMQVEYHTNESVLHADSLARFDAIFAYNAKKGGKTDRTPDLTSAQEDALYAWVEAGHAFVAAHSASSSYLENPRWAALIGGAYTEHGNAFQYVSIAAPQHGAMQGVSPPTAWDEGRRHELLRQDLEILETLNDEKTPWTWVHPQGKGRVYYTSSGHDVRTWSDTAYQGQLVQAIRWAVSASTPVSVARNPAGKRPGRARPRMDGASAHGLGDRTPGPSDTPTLLYRGRQADGKAFPAASHADATR